MTGVQTCALLIYAVRLIMITLVKDAIADEEIRREPPQKLLIINRCTLGVFLSFKIPLHLMKPGLICYLFSLDATTMYGQIMVTLVKNAIADEELRREPPQKLLIIDRFPFRIFLSLEIPFLLRETRVCLPPFRYQSHSSALVHPTFRW